MNSLLCSDGAREPPDFTISALRAAAVGAENGFTGAIKRLLGEECRRRRVAEKRRGRAVRLVHHLAVAIGRDEQGARVDRLAP